MLLLYCCNFCSTTSRSAYEQLNVNILAIIFCYKNGIPLMRIIRTNKWVMRFLLCACVCVCVCTKYASSEKCNFSTKLKSVDFGFLWLDLNWLQREKKKNFCYEPKLQQQHKWNEKETTEEYASKPERYVCINMKRIWKLLTTFHKMSFIRCSSHIYSTKFFFRCITFTALSIRFKFLSHHVARKKNGFGSKRICWAPSGKCGGTFICLALTEVP